MSDLRFVVVVLLLAVSVFAGPKEALERLESLYQKGLYSELYKETIVELDKASQNSYSILKFKDIIKKIEEPTVEMFDFFFVLMKRNDFYHSTGADLMTEMLVRLVQKGEMDLFYETIFQSSDSVALKASLESIKYVEITQERFIDLILKTSQIIYKEAREYKDAMFFLSLALNAATKKYLIDLRALTNKDLFYSVSRRILFQTKVKFFYSSIHRETILRLEEEGSEESLSLVNEYYSWRERGDSASSSNSFCPRFFK